VERNVAPQIKRSLLNRWEPMYRSRLHYFVTWSTRGRRPVLRPRHVASLQGLIQQFCDERGYALIEVAAGSDHAHVLIGLQPAQSISSVVRELKGRAGMALLTEFPELRVWLRGNLVWDERYAVETVSPARIDRVRARIRSHHAPPDELARAS
jgi:REP element-mobilizing transposase RayT